MQLVETGHNAWMSITVYTMLSPYLISYVPLINFQIQNYEQNNNANNFKNFHAIIILTPLVLTYLASMDVFYIVASVGVTSIVLILKLLTCNKIPFFDVDAQMDKVYGYLFHMKSMDIEHFRHLRTIS